MEKNDQDKINILTLKRLHIFNEDGEEILVKTLWESCSSVVIIFLRHFSCIACSAHIQKVWSSRDKIKKKKGRIVFIGNGSHSMIKTFKNELGFKDAEVFTDPTLKTFDACGLKRGVSNLVNLKSAKAMYNLKKEGFSQGEMNSDSGSHRQMGGIIVFKDPGKVLYHYASEYLGDFDNPETDWQLEDDNSKL